MQASALLTAGKTYVRESYDANELIEFAARSQRKGGLDADVIDYCDRALAACRRAATALHDITSLLPTPAESGEARRATLLRARGGSLCSHTMGAAASFLAAKGDLAGSARWAARAASVAAVALGRDSDWGPAAD